MLSEARNQHKSPLQSSSSRSGVISRAGIKIHSRTDEIPKIWYNIVSDLPLKPPPPLHPRTLEPLKPEDLSHLFPNDLISQEASTERFIDIPDEVIDIYSLWRPTPLIRYFLSPHYKIFQRRENYDSPPPPPPPPPPKIQGQETGKAFGYSCKNLLQV